MIAGLCLSDPHPDRSGDGSPRRTLSAAHFAGRYRLVDFMLSNMVNSKITNIGMILNSHYQSLIGHIGMGKEWDLARKSGGVTFFPPYHADERKSVNNELDGPLQRAVTFLHESNVEYVVVADSSVVCNIDYRPAIEAHKNSEADITAIYTRKHIHSGECDSAVVFQISKDSRITAIDKTPGTSKIVNLSIGSFIMPKEIFIELTAGEKNCGMLHFSKSLISGSIKKLNVQAYEFEGYAAHVCSIGTFFHYNMDMLDTEKRHALFSVEGRQISTNRRDSLPAKYGKSAHISNSIVADGCQIEGTLINSVVCRNVRIAPGAVVKNCILQDGTTVEKNATLDYVITDRLVSISEDRNMMGHHTYPLYIEISRTI